MLPPLKNLRAEDWYLAFFVLMLLQVCALAVIASTLTQIQNHSSKIESYISDWEVTSP